MSTKDTGLYGMPGVTVHPLDEGVRAHFNSLPSVPHGMATHAAMGPQPDDGEGYDEERPDPTMGDVEAAGGDMPPEPEKHDELPRSYAPRAARPALVQAPRELDAHAHLRHGVHTP
jgi:hypothetical protein